MSDTTWLWGALGIGVALLSLPGSLALFVLTAAGVLPQPRRRRAAPGAGARVVVVVPAHDEEANIARTVASLRACVGEGARARVVVIADNCSDATAQRAREAGADVFERFDKEKRGKGYALDFAFTRLIAEGEERFLVVDADTLVAPTLIDEASAAFDDGADAVQARYGVLNAGESLRTRLMSVALFAFNVLRPRGRERLGLSCGISGNGFGLTRATLEAVPYACAASIVEDLEYHIRLVEAGKRVRFLDRTQVLADMPSGREASATQRARWEGGRFLMIRESAPRLLLRALAGRPRLLEPLFELLLLPLAYHVTLLLAALAVPFTPSRLYGLAGLAIVAAHVVLGVLVGRGGWRSFAALLAAPFYVLWKLALTLRIVRSASRNTAWVRTARADGQGGRP